MPIANLNPQGVLAQIKNVVSKHVYKAIKYILTPCCDVDNIEGVTFTSLEINGTPVVSQDITVIILTKDSPYLVGKAVVTIDSSGDGTV